MILELEPMANRLKESRVHLLEAVEGLPEELLRAPYPGRDWSIHDTLSHLAANEALMTDLARGIATSRNPRVPADFDNDRFNAESVAARRDKSAGEILDELVASRLRLMDFLDSVMPDQLSRRGTHPLAGELNLREFLTVMYAHEVTHTQEITEQRRVLAA